MHDSLNGARVSYRNAPLSWASVEIEPKPYAKDAAKWVMMPAYAKPRRVSLDALAAVTNMAGNVRIQPH